MSVKATTTLEVTVDKRHIISIGERLYTESAAGKPPEPGQSPSPLTLYS